MEQRSDDRTPFRVHEDPPPDKRVPFGRVAVAAPRKAQAGERALQLLGAFALDGVKLMRIGFAPDHRLATRSELAYLARGDHRQHHRGPHQRSPRGTDAGHSPGRV